MQGAADQDDAAPTPDPRCEDQDLGAEPEALVHPCAECLEVRDAAGRCLCHVLEP